MPHTYSYFPPATIMLISPPPKKELTTAPARVCMDSMFRLMFDAFVMKDLGLFFDSLNKI